MSRYILIVSLIATACVPRALIADARDRDDDGHVAWQLGGDDCDDAEPTANPGEDELCGDGIDNDCDDAIDDDGVNAATWYPDLDDDGYAVDAPITACTRPAHHRASLDAGIDCDDTKADVHPGAPDAWYDGVDSNCDEADDHDQDGDTHRAPSGGGADCDDTDDDVHPDASEVCGNHADDDCDGTHNACAWSGDVDLEGTRHANLVWAFSTPTVVRASVGDTNLDGADDVLVTGLESGDIFLFEGPLAGTRLTSLHANVHLTLPDPPNIFGYGASIGGDLDGDGAKDLLLTNAEEAGRPVVFASLAPFRSQMDVEDITKTFYGLDPETTPSTGFGFGAGIVGDLDGDGVDHFFVTESGTDPSVCYLLEGMGAGTNMPNIATSTLSACTGALGAVPDLNGDGFPDVAAPSTDALRVVSGEPSGAIDLASAPLFTAWTGGNRLGAIRGVDHSLNDDDTPDLIVTVAPPSRQTAATEVLLGPLTGATPTTPRIRFEPADGDDAYFPLRPVDINGDGHDDAVLAHIARNLTTGEGEVDIDVFAGPLEPGVYSRADATARVSLLPELVLFLNFDTGDVDGDGYGDVVVGGYGVAYVIYGQGHHMITLGAEGAVG